MRRPRLKKMIADWRRDGVTLIEVTRRESEGAEWILYKATEPQSTSDYGRHYALLLAVDSKDRVVAHNFHNTSSHSTRSFTEQALDWFNRHVEEGLVTPEGDRICV